MGKNKAPMYAFHFNLRTPMEKEQTFNFVKSILLKEKMYCSAETLEMGFIPETFDEFGNYYHGLEKLVDFNSKEREYKTLQTLEYMLCRHPHNKDEKDALEHCAELVKRSIYLK